MYNIPLDLLEDFVTKPLCMCGKDEKERRGDLDDVKGQVLSFKCF